jgi:AraC-like DNA-binding protein
MITQKTSSYGGRSLQLSVHGLGATERASHRTEAPSLLVTLEAAIAEVSFGPTVVTVDRSLCLLVPARTRVVIRTSAPSSRVAILAFQEPLLRRVARTYRKLGLDRERLERWLRSASVIPRTLWLHEIVHRYVFERYALGQHDNEATRFLETEILKEVYFLFRDREDGADRATVVRRHGAVVERAIAHVESHLYDAVDVGVLAAVAGASESTLLRAFRRDVGCTPGAYWRQRRLEEALVLIRSGRHAIAQVASRVGYDNPTAFAFAFRKRFKMPPSSFVPRAPARRAP